eukprot:Skav231250  [mRNA]  locus=scaffold411:436966:439190:- [translate_table: standard]
MVPRLGLDDLHHVFLAAVRRWIPSDEEHHGWMLHDLARMTMELPKALPLPKRLGGETATASRASQACILTLSVPGAARRVVLIHVFYLCMLVFPSVLFGLLIYLGSEHGDDRCPFDLDALLVWFGALGLAVLVMDCANDGASACAAPCIRMSPTMADKAAKGLREGRM